MSCKPFLLAFLLLSPALQAQLLPQRDSLLTILEKAKIRDSTYVKTLNNLSQVYRSLFPDSAFLFATRANRIADSIHFEKGVARSLNFMGIAQFFKGNVPEAQQLQMKALSYSEDHHFPELTANALNSLALALQYQGNYFLAMDYYLQSLKIEEQRNNELGMIKVMANMGTLYKRMEEYDDAIKISERALSLSMSLPNTKTSQANLYTTLGNAYAQKNSYEKAISYMQHALEINTEVGNKVGTSMSNLNLGYFNLSLGKLTDAEKYLRSAMALAKSAGTYETSALALMDLAEVRLQQKRPNEALVFAKESYRIFKQHNFKDQIVPISQTLARIYEALGNHQAGYQYLQQATQLDDSIKSAAAKKKINYLSSTYELHKKELEVFQLEQESKLREALLQKEQTLKWGLALLAIVLIVLIGLFYYAFKTKSRLSQQLENQNKLIELINKDLKVQALRAQMNPHFIFNSLNSIQFLIMSNESERAFDYLSKFALLLRRVMDNSVKNWVPLAEEADLLNLYIELESLRFDGSFSYEVNMDLESGMEYKVPPMVIQPYIENAILHGLMPKEADRQLKVTFSGKGNQLWCEVWDNGIGREEANRISQKKNKLFVSKGMNFISERLQVLNVNGEGKSTVTIVDRMESEKPAGTSVKLFFEYA